MLKVGEEVEAKFTSVDRKSRTIALSIKAKEMHEESRSGAELPHSESSSGTSLGDLLKEHIGGQDELTASRGDGLTSGRLAAAAPRGLPRFCRKMTTSGLT